MFFKDAVVQSYPFVNIANVAVACAWRIVNLVSVIAPREHVFSIFFKYASCVVLRGVWFLMFFKDAVVQSDRFVNIANVAVACAWRIENVFSVIAPREHVFSIFFRYASCVVAWRLIFDVFFLARKTYFLLLNHFKRIMFFFD